MKKENENNNIENVQNLAQLENKIVNQEQMDNNINFNNIESNTNQEELDKELVQENEQEMYEQENNQENINYENYQNENDMNNIDMNMEYNNENDNINENLNIEEDFDQNKQDDNDINENKYNNNNFNNVDINELKELSDTNNMNNNINNLNIYNNMDENFGNNMIDNNMMDNNINNNIENQYYDDNEGEEYNENEIDNENEDYQNNINENNEIINNDMKNIEYNEEEFENLLNNLNIEEMKEYVKKLKNEYDLVLNENNQLKMAADTQMNNNQHIINLKKQNNFYLEKIKELQMQNKKIGKELIEYKNKLKLQNNKNLNQNANLNVMPNNIELIKLDSKIHEYESLISKLNLEKKILESRIENMQKDNQNEINLLTNYKNSEIQSYKKIINDLKNKEKNNINNINLNKKIYNNKIEEDSKFYLDKIKIFQQNNEQLSENIFRLEEENKNLKNEIDKNNLNTKYKDEIIKNLNDKMISFKNEYNGLINSLEIDYNQSQLQVQHLLSENEKLMKENNDMEMGIKMMNEKVKDSLIMYDNKKNQFIKEVQAYKNKLKEYKIKIITLKRRIDELIGNNNFGYKGNTFALRKDNSAILNNNIKYFIPNKASCSQGKLNFGFSNNNFI